MVVRKPHPGPLTPGDWARAALAAIARGSIGAIAVESVAADLGATKGSFYWHFKTYVGYLQMAHVAPEVVGDDTRQRHVHLILGTLVAGRLPAEQTGPG